MKKIIYISIIILLCKTTYSQTNLVPNPSFESYSQCPFNNDQLNYAIPWFKPTIGSPDYYNNCFFTTSFLGYQLPKDGDGQSGFYACYFAPPFSNYREYIEVRLNDSLSTGNKYCIQFYLSLADSSNYATDGISISLSSDSLSSNNYQPLLASNIVSNPNGNYVIDKINWTLLSFEYIASGGERFLTIGNFFNDFNTDTIRLTGGTTSADYNASYYYIDEIQVVICDSINSIQSNLEGGNEIQIQNIDNSLININSSLSEDSNIKIINNLGQIVYSEVLIGKGKASIAMESFASGIYLVLIENNKIRKTNKIYIK